MAIALSTAGAKLKWAVESTAGTQPTTGYTAISGIKSISDLNPEPNMLDCTPLEETYAKNYISGLRDVGGVVTLTANNTDAFQTAWTALITASETAEASDKATWFEITIPNLTKSFYFKGKPNALGLSALEVDSVAEISAYITPNKLEGWGTAST